MKRLTPFLLLLLIDVTAQAQVPTFISGNLAVLRWGDGSQPLSTSGNSVFIDEFAVAGTNATAVSTTVLPDSGAGALILDGTAISEGGLTRSMDGTVLAVTGYNTNLSSPAVIAAGALGNTAAITVPRELATIDAFGNYTQVQTITGYYGTQSPRFAVTDGTNNFWVSAGINGIVYFNPPSASQPISTSLVNNRAIRIFGGNLFFSTQKASPTSNNGIYTFTTTPGSYTPAGLVTTPSVGTNQFITTGSASAVSDFALSDDGLTAYIADTTQGVQKWVNNAGTWNLAHTFALASAPQPAGAFAIAVDFSQADPIIYATTTETNSTSNKSVGGNHLVRIVDTNASATVVYLAQAKTNQAFKGLDFVPDLRPKITGQPQSQMVTNGTADVLLSVAATSPRTLGYQWQVNGHDVADDADISGSTSPTLTFLTCRTTHQGNYTVVVTNQFGAVTSAVAVLTVSLEPIAPAITVQPLSTTNFIGANFRLSVSANGTAPLGYQWVHIVAGVTNELVDGLGAFGELITGATSNSVMVANAQPQDAGSYAVVVSNAAGATNSHLATVTLVPVRPAISAQPVPLTVASGSTATFQVTASGTSPDYQWKFNGVPLTDGPGAHGESFSGSTSSTLSIYNAQTNDIGSYSVTVTNQAGSTNSQAVLLGVIVLPPPSFISYTTVGSTYTQDFNSLPSPGTNFTVTVPAGNPVIINGTNYSFGNANPYDFAAPILPTGSPGGLGQASSMAGWYGWVEGGAGVNRFGANAGDYTTGGIQSYGATNSYAESQDRALGIQTTAESRQSAVAARFINHTPATLTRITLQFTGELWRQSVVPKSLVFHYVIDPTGTNGFDTNPSDFVFIPPLDVNFPTNAAASGGVPVNGNLPANQLSKSVVNQVIADWPSGGALWLVWQYTNSTGKAQGVAIDNLTFSATADGSGPGEPAALTGISHNSQDGSVSFSITGQAGYGYVVEYTTNLVSPVYWRSLQTNTVGAGAWLFTDPSPGDAPARFYRVRSQ